MIYALYGAHTDLHGDVANDCAALDRQLGAFLNGIERNSELLGVYDDYETVKKEFDLWNVVCGIWLNNKHRRPYINVVYVLGFENDDDYDNFNNYEWFLMTDVENKIHE